jgi:uncharacterized RDD family membrane protein YckC
MPTGPRASFFPRLVGLIIDAVLIGIVNQVVDAVTAAAVGLILGIIVSAGYHVYFIASGSGQTPGMRVMSVRAIDATHGGRVAPGQALVRWVMGIVSGLACFLGYLWMLWDPEKQTWHDKVARTYVVPTASFPVERWPG